MPKEKETTRSTSNRAYKIVGLQESDSMPIIFAGREFDLANLSADELAFLREHPEQVPYLK